MPPAQCQQEERPQSPLWRNRISKAVGTNIFIVVVLLSTLAESAQNSQSSNTEEGESSAHTELHSGGKRLKEELRRLLEENGIGSRKRRANERAPEGGNQAAAAGFPTTDEVPIAYARLPVKYLHRSGSQVYYPSSWHGELRPNGTLPPRESDVVFRTVLELTPQSFGAAIRFSPESLVLVYRDWDANLPRYFSALNNTLELDPATIAAEDPLDAARGRSWGVRARVARLNHSSRSNYFGWEVAPGVDGGVIIPAVSKGVSDSAMPGSVPLSARRQGMPRMLKLALNAARYPDLAGFAQRVATPAVFLVRPLAQAVLFKGPLTSWHLSLFAFHESHRFREISSWHSVHQLLQHDEQVAVIFVHHSSPPAAHSTHMAAVEALLLGTSLRSSLMLRVMPTVIMDEAKLPPDETVPDGWLPRKGCAARESLPTKFVPGQCLVLDEQLEWLLDPLASSAVGPLGDATIIIFRRLVVGNGKLAGRHEIHWLHFKVPHILRSAEPSSSLSDTNHLAKRWQDEVVNSIHDFIRGFSRPILAPIGSFNFQFTMKRLATTTNRCELCPASKRYHHEQLTAALPPYLAFTENVTVPPAEVLAGLSDPLVLVFHRSVRFDAPQGMSAPDHPCLALARRAASRHPGSAHYFQVDVETSFIILELLLKRLRDFFGAESSAFDDLRSAAEHVINASASWTVRPSCLIGLVFPRVVDGFLAIVDIGGHYSRVRAKESGRDIPLTPHFPASSGDILILLQNVIDARRRSVRFHAKPSRAEAALRNLFPQRSSAVCGRGSPMYTHSSRKAIQALLSGELPTAAAAWGVHLQPSATRDPASAGIDSIPTVGSPVRNLMYVLPSECRRLEDDDVRAELLVVVEAPRRCALGRHLSNAAQLLAKQHSAAGALRGGELHVLTCDVTGRSAAGSQCRLPLPLSRIEAAGLPTLLFVNQSAVVLYRGFDHTLGGVRQFFNTYAAEPLLAMPADATSGAQADGHAPHGGLSEGRRRLRDAVYRRFKS